jgi:hypothetical protein
LASRSQKQRRIFHGTAAAVQAGSQNERERRVFADPSYMGPERRRSQERREGDRRAER